ncbi:MAG: NAD-dependent epimerase/dehydratase family protein [Rhodospirillales bacterium]|nr:NAD-dependent epimerase/dehydratase family protein [Rhodospirillales bacterium]
MRILVTGANGWIGRAVCADLTGRGHEVVAAVRRPDRAAGIACARSVAVGAIGPGTDWRAALEGVTAVVHTAARVHVPAATDPESFAVNVEGTRALALAAAAAGVRRFVFLSTVKVLGETTENRAPFSETDPPAPDPNDAYARSKAAAETELANVAAARNLAIVILRPPLVYGPGAVPPAGGQTKESPTAPGLWSGRPAPPGARGNFAALVRLVRIAPPLPFGRIANRRSLLFLGNLVDAIALALDHPQAAGETFLVRDGQDVSTPELIHKIAGHLGRPARLFPFSPSLLRLAAKLTGQGLRAGRLLDSLELNDQKIRDRLGWRPPYSLDRGLAEALGSPTPSQAQQRTSSA